MKEIQAEIFNDINELNQFIQQTIDIKVINIETIVKDAVHQSPWNKKKYQEEYIKLWFTI